MNIGQYNLDSDVFIVAEIGNNHEGDFERAKEMVIAAAEAGTHAVKFQTFVPDKYASATDQARITQLNGFRLNEDQYRELVQLAADRNVVFLSTPFDLESAQFLNEFVPAFKISSSDNDFYPLIETIAKTGKPIILSTGLADLEQISRTESYIDQVWRKNNINQEVAILHCVSCYPTSPQQANLMAIQTIKQEFGGVVGYSDHTLGIEAAVLSVVLGAKIVEKHFTLDKNLSEFRDHQLSADPNEFAAMVKRINDVQAYLGDGNLKPCDEEQQMVEKLRRSIVAENPLAAGTVLTEKDICWVRPGGGVAPGQEDQLLGKTLVKAIDKGQKILSEDVKG